MNTANGRKPVFELENVTRRFGKILALEGINLRIFAGERVALVGPSGAGKSTLINLMNGTLLPTSGVVHSMGCDLGTLSPRALRRVQGQIGTIYQQFQLVDNLQVIHNVNAGHLSRWSLLKAIFSLVAPREVTTALGALQQVGIAEKLYERTDQLSGGQQQRVAIARVLVQNPQAILADEPVSNLDPELSREIMDILLQLSQETGKTLVISLHTIEFAPRYCERIVGLRRGRVLFDIPAGDLTKRMIKAVYEII